MRKTIIVATTAVMLATGSIFALSGSGAEKASARAVTEQCPPDCCEGNGGICTPNQCKTGGPQCCNQ